MISFWLLAFIFQDPRWNALLLGTILALFVVARFPKSVLVLLARIALPLAALFVVMWSFLLPSGRTLGGFVVPLVNVTIAVTSDGLLWGVIASSRILVLLLSTLTFLVTTSETDLTTGLRGLRIPYLVSFVISLTFRLMSVVNGDLATIQDARKARALPEKMNPLTRIKTALSLVVPLVMVSVRRIQSITNSIEARGFSPGAKGPFIMSQSRQRLRDY